MTSVYIRTVEELDAGVKMGVTNEDLVLDFKTTIDNWDLPKAAKDYHKLKAKAEQETCRDIAQFANTNGGCLLIGVEERLDLATGLKVAVAINQVSEPDKMREWIEQAIANYLVPATFAHPIDILRDPRGIVVAVNVPPSLHLVALWHSERRSQFEEKHSIEYLYRDSHGKKWMNPDEVERHIMNGSRAAKLAFELAVSQATKHEVRVAGGYWGFPEDPRPNDKYSPWNVKGSVTIGRTNEHWFELIIPYGSATRCINLPYSVVEHVWVGSDEQLNLLLSVRVVFRGDQFTLEPAA